MATAWMDHLNPAQRQAVTHGDGPLLIIAGAGTGKTNTLACRVAWLLQQGVRAERILLLTFSRRAASEMLRRAEHIAGPAAGQVWGGTFHAIANRLLRQYGRALGLPANFTVVDQSDAADLMNLLRSELGLARTDRRFPRKETLVHIYSRMVNSQLKLADVLEVHFPWCRDGVEGIRSIFEQYTRRKREQAVLDYDDLLLFFKALVAAGPLADQVAGLFDHVLVDEYQDTNLLQADILRGLRRRNANVTVVGDDAQAIYGFRAATVRNILDFPTQFPGTRVVTLEQNYRSVQPILDAANAVMADAGEQYAKRLWSTRASEQRPVLVSCTDEARQTEAVCEAVLTHREAGVPLKRQAVLMRTGHHSDLLEVELARRNIPFVKYGGLKFIEAAHVKDLLACLRILDNPHDELAWFRVLLMLDGVGPQTARRLMEALGVRRAGGEPRPTPLLGGTAIERADAAPADPLGGLSAATASAPKAARRELESLAAALADCVRVPDGRVGIQVERLRRFYQPIFERLYDNAHVRVRDLEQLEQAAAGYSSRSSFITDLTLDPPSVTSDLAGPPLLDEDYLVLSTIHSAKGLEFDVVHVLHASDGNIPSDMATGDAESIAEERRLFYVALTRARDRLYVYFPLRYYRRRYGDTDAHMYAQLTRFITPAHRALFEDHGPPPPPTADPAAPALPAPQVVDNWLASLWQG